MALVHWARFGKIVQRQSFARANGTAKGVVSCCGF